MSSVVYLMIRDDFSVLSFGFADQNVILWSPVKFGGLRSRRLGVGRELVLLVVTAMFLVIVYETPLKSPLNRHRLCGFGWLKQLSFIAILPNS
ncbi:unnamed protein product [Microthlaspi erraticum]|uniref:Uncharacterized protein n=1 Tax=Microthlaspi erraticum TaxID=1685480 RepID=A0A6D2JBG7_9BRAS|nr:unnamed protein product [Microthlaspi erraticum]